MSEILASAASLASSLPWVGGNLRPASIRGIPFYVKQGDDEPGRRWVTHEFPGRDDPWHEDLGAKTREFALEGLLIGANVVFQAKAIAAAAEAKETATLMHPWYGVMEVVILDCRIRHDVDEARVARIALRVQKAGKRPAPLIEQDGISRVLSEADRLLSVAQAEYARLSAMVGAVDYVVSAVRSSVTGFVSAAQGALSGSGLVGGLLGTLGTALSALSDASDAVIVSDTDLPAAVVAVPREISALAGEPASFATVESDIDPAPDAAFAALAALATTSPIASAEAGSTPSRVQIATATAALSVVADAAIAGELARATTAVTWASRDEAMAARDQVEAALSAAADRAAVLGWDDAWRSLIALRAASATDLAARAAPLPRLRQVTLAASLPASLLAYRLDGDALDDVFARGVAIAERNRVRNPGFLPAGLPIEVLL